MVGRVLPRHDARWPPAQQAVRLLAGTVAPITILVVAIVAGGAALLALARFSRRKHEELRQDGVGEWYPALLNGRFSGVDGLKIYFFGAQPKPIALVGRVLACLVV